MTSEEKLSKGLQLIGEALIEISKSINQVKEPQKNVSNTRLNPNEAAEYIGCKYSKLMHMAKNNEIPSFKIGNRVFFMKEKLDKWIENKMNNK